MGATGLEVHSSGQNLNIEHYKMLFNILYEEHNNYCNKQIKPDGKEFNLKRTCICDIYESGKGLEENFYKYVIDYLHGFNELEHKILFNIYEKNVVHIRVRTKEFTSIIYKIDNKSKQQNGKLPIYKYLNDLLGFRIVDNNYNDNIEYVRNYLEYLIEDKYKHRIRYVNQNNDNYKGDHIYFLGQDNKFFPMELQIWNREYEQKNIESHSKYKQEYLKWLKEYNKF